MIRYSPFVILLFLVCSCQSSAQKGISFKGGTYEVNGKSGGSIAGTDNRPTSYESFWEISNGKLTCTVIQEFGRGENTKDIEIHSLLLGDIDKNFEYEEARLMENDFAVPAYLVTITTRNSENLITRKGCYRFSPTDKIEEVTKVYTFRIYFADEAGAKALIKEIKSHL